jgi:hypothetical protein
VPYHVSHYLSASAMTRNDQSSTLATLTVTMITITTTTTMKGGITTIKTTTRTVVNMLLNSNHGKRNYGFHGLLDHYGMIFISLLPNNSSGNNNNGIMDNLLLHHIICNNNNNNNNKRFINSSSRND